MPGQQGGARSLQIQLMAGSGDIKPQCRYMAPIQDHLIPAVDACDLIEQNYPAVQEICISVILLEEFPEKLTTSPRAEANVARG
jgi:hypothetical protein